MRALLALILLLAILPALGYFNTLVEAQRDRAQGIYEVLADERENVYVMKLRRDLFMRRENIYVYVDPETDMFDREWYTKEDFRKRVLFGKFGAPPSGIAPIYEIPANSLKVIVSERDIRVLEVPIQYLVQDLDWIQDLLSQEVEEYVQVYEHILDHKAYVEVFLDSIDLSIREYSWIYRILLYARVDAITRSLESGEYSLNAFKSAILDKMIAPTLEPVRVTVEELSKKLGVEVVVIRAMLVTDAKSTRMHNLIIAFNDAEHLSLEELAEIGREIRRRLGVDAILIEERPFTRYTPELRRACEETSKTVSLWPAFEEERMCLEIIEKPPIDLPPLADKEMKIIEWLEAKIIWQGYTLEELEKIARERGLSEQGLLRLRYTYYFWRKVIFERAPLEEIRRLDLPEEYLLHLEYWLKVEECKDRVKMKATIPCLIGIGSLPHSRLYIPREVLHLEYGCVMTYMRDKGISLEEFIDEIVGRLQSLPCFRDRVVFIDISPMEVVIPLPGKPSQEMSIGELGTLVPLAVGVLMVVAGLGLLGLAKMRRYGAASS